MPVKHHGGRPYEVIDGYEHDEFAKGKIAATNDELVGERDTVKEMLA